MKVLKGMLLATVAVVALSGFGQLAWADEAAKGAPEGGAAPKVETKKYDKHKKYDPKASFERFSKKLNLTADQKEKIRPILNDEVKAIRDLYQEARDKEMKVLDDTHARVKALLTPDQQKKYDAMIAKRKADYKKYFHKHEMMYEESGGKTEHPEMGEHPATSGK